MKKSKKLTFLTVAVATLCAVSSFAAIPQADYSAKADASDVPTVESLFTTTDGVTLTTNTDTPAYVAEKQNGVHVRATSASTVTYNRLIDVTELTQATTLFEVQITPTAAGVSEFNQLLVRVEDSENPKSYFEISLYRYYWEGPVDAVTHVSVQADSVSAYNGRYYTNNYETKVVKEPILDAETGDPVLGEDGQPTYNERKEYIDHPSYYMRSGVRQATMIQGPFGGAKNGWSNSIKIYYNDAEKAVYTKDASVWSPNMNTGILTEAGIADKDGKLVVLDMDNLEDMGNVKTNLWSGFDSGKVRISFTADDLFGEYANYMILKINDQAMDGEYLNDVTAPKLSVDLDGYDETELPEAKVGQKYPFFSATAIDKMYGEVDVKTHVYKDGKEIYSTGDGFVPETAGDYVVEYAAYDGNRNTATERFTVTAKETISSLTGKLNVPVGAIDFSDDELKNANGNFPVKLYYPVTLPNMTATGGSGHATAEMQILFNGKKTSYSANGTFVPQTAGVYEVRYVLSDFIGNTKTCEYRLEATYEASPRLLEPSLPDYLSVGKSVKFPAVEAELYTVWQQKITTYDVINVYKADGTTKIVSFEGNTPAIYTPQAADGETVIVEYCTAKDANSSFTTYRKTIKILSANKLSDRFATDEGISLIEKSASLNYSFSASAEGKFVRFINPLSVCDGLRIVFDVPDATKEKAVDGESNYIYKNNYTEIRFKIVDANDADNYVYVSFYKNPEADALTSFVSVNGGAKVSYPVSFYGNVNDNFIFTVQADGSVYNANGDLLSEAADFSGFTSDSVYVEFTLLGITGEAELSVIQIKNQIIGDTDEDFINPVLTVFEEPVGLAELGDTIEIGGAIANDVYDVKTKLEVTITFNDKEIFAYTDLFGRFDGTSLVATDYGIYKITYKATDESGNSTSRSYSVEIRDVIAPTITIKGEMPTTWTKGTTFAFPEVVVSDNVDVDLVLYTIVINPMNVYTVMEEGDVYTPTMSGRFIVRFYCQDSRYNTTYSVDYIIQVQ